MVDISGAPHFDDFNEEAGFHQILFVPDRAVQNRELIQLQTILRDQIKKFGNHVFQHGSIVIPGNSLADIGVPFIKLQPTYSGADVDISQFENQTIVGATTGIEATVKKVVSATTDEPIVFYLAYTSGSSAGDIVFVDGEEIYVKSDVTQRATLASSSATGQGSLAYINRGVYYVNGSFVYVPAQSVVISKFTTNPSCYVLLRINEEIIDYTMDETLLDNAQGSYNYAAHGADRLKITLTLVALPLTTALNDNYIEIMRYDNGELQEHARNPKYSELEKSLARRTFDESGSYVVSGLSSKIREHLKEGFNGGVYANGDGDKLVVEVSPGKAYINGFEVDKIAPSRIAIDKARTASHIKNTSVTLRPEFGQYIIVCEPKGSLSIYDRDTVQLYNDSDQDNMSATNIGSATVMGIDYLAGDPATNAMYKLWLSNVTMLPGFGIDAAGGIRYGSGNYATVLQELYVPVTAGSFSAEEIVSHSSGRKATVHYWDSAASRLYVFKHDHTFDAPKAGDLIIGATSVTQGTVTSKQVLVSKGQSNLVFNLPKSIPSTIKNLTAAYDLSYTIQKELIILTDGTGAGSASISSGQISAIETGSFMAIGPAGVVNNGLFTVDELGSTVTLSGGPLSSTVRVYASVVKTDVSPKTKTLTNHTMSITTPSAIEQLEHADIVGLVSVIDDVGDITANYEFWNGQTDYQYELGELMLKSGRPAPSGNIIVTYKYYAHSITGDFFCVDSYASVDNYLESMSMFSSITTGNTQDLMTCIDFRPTVGSDNTLTGAGSRRNDLVVPSTYFNTFLQYYVPRIDIMVADVSGRISVVPGTPAERPTPPQAPVNSVPIEMLYIPEYTRSAEGVTVKRLDVDRFTMKDIKAVVKRVENLEEFATLTSAEVATTKYDIIDADTGLNRYKTGYIVESFDQPFALARTTSNDFTTTFVGNTLRAGMEPLICDVSINNSTLQVNGNFLSLPYTEAEFASQTLSSRTTNINPFVVIKWDGILSVFPSSDVWTDVVDLPTVYESKTDVITVRECTNPKPSVASVATYVDESYGGWYGTVVNRAGETGGVDYWIGDVRRHGVDNVASYFLTAAEENYNKSTEYTFNPGYAASSLLETAGDVLTSTTKTTYQVITYSDGTKQTQAVSSSTSGVKVTGQTFSY